MTAGQEEGPRPSLGKPLSQESLDTAYVPVPLSDSLGTDDNLLHLGLAFSA